MKLLILGAALTVICAVPGRAQTQTQVPPAYDCTQTNGASHLVVFSAQSQNPSEFSADLITTNSEAMTSQTLHFSGSNIPDPQTATYPLVDANGNSASLTISAGHHHPCGRGICDTSSFVYTTATLFYLDQAQVFSCH